jgi:hypothetical protein
MQGRRVAQAKAKTVEWRKWKALNLTDARPTIDDDELAWLENAIIVGNGAIQILPAPGVAVASIGTGITTLWGFTINGDPFLYSVNADGGIAQITPSGAATLIAPPGTVTGGIQTHLTSWQSSRILIVDHNTGYFTWDGATFTTIDATVKGDAIAVFEGRAWIALGRTIQYTAPTTYNDFTAGNGAGSVVITDEAFDGNVVALVSALEELWIIGQSSIDALANVQASGVPPNVATTFSITNIVTNLGTNAAQSVVGYLRALAFLAPFGAYALSGVTPQKLSGKLDGLFNSLSIVNTISAAVAVVQNLLALIFAVTYTGTNAASGAGPLTMLLGFSEGRWFQAVQDTTLPLKWITSLVVNGVAQAWGTDGTLIYRLFGGDPSTPVTYKIQTRLSPFDRSTQEKSVTKVALELQANFPVAPLLYADSESGGSELVSLQLSNQLQIVNFLTQPLNLVNGGGQPLTLVSTGLVLGRGYSNQFGHYLGFTLQGTDPPYRVQMFGWEIEPTREWSTP